MNLTVVSPIAMMFFCVFIFACIPWVLTIFALMLGKKSGEDITGISVLFALAGWAFGYAFFSTP